MRNPIRLVIIALTALLGTASALPAAALEPHHRGRWMIGGGLGMGTARIGVTTEVGDIGLLDTGWTEGAAVQLRIGWVFVPDRFMLSFENKQWLDEQAAPEELVNSRLIKLRSNVQSWVFAVTWFPGSIDGPTGGLYFKAGGGWSNARFAVLRPATEEEEEASGGNTFTEIGLEDDAGSAWFVETGYEFRVFKSFAPGLAVTYSYLDVNDGAVYRDAKTIHGTLTLNWYF